MQDVLVTELLFRNKIKDQRNVGVICLGKDYDIEKNKFCIPVEEKTSRCFKYIIVFDFDTRETGTLEKILSLNSCEFLILIHYQSSFLYHRTTLPLDDIMTYLRERYIKVLDVDRLCSREHVLCREEYFSIICEFFIPR
jgi:hypothetical protein